MKTDMKKGDLAAAQLITPRGRNLRVGSNGRRPT
jgi:hypothetical protein